MSFLAGVRDRLRGSIGGTPDEAGNHVGSPLYAYPYVMFSKTAVGLPYTSKGTYVLFVLDEGFPLHVCLRKLPAGKSLVPC